MKVTIELAVRTRKKKVPIGAIEMEVKLTDRVDLVMDQIVNLTQREIQVRDAILLGLANKEIATKLFLSVRTVKFHVSTLYEKYGVRNRTELVYGLARAKKVEEGASSTCSPQIKERNGSASL